MTLEELLEFPFPNGYRYLITFVYIKFLLKMDNDIRMLLLYACWSSIC